jgi:hypothetical protein
MLSQAAQVDGKHDSQPLVRDQSNDASCLLSEGVRLHQCLPSGGSSTPGHLGSYLGGHASHAS